MSKKPKHKGKPAKFVVDENGKEVYGLSYNAASGMFYATFSNPRVYFGGGKKRHEAQKALAIERFKEYQKHQHLSPEQQAEAAFLDEVYKKARELITNGKCIQQELNEKARELLNLGELSQIVDEKVGQELEQRLQKGELSNYLQAYLETYAGLQLVERRAAQLLPNLIMDDKISDAMSEQFEKLIKKRPVQAAKLLGAKQLVYFTDMQFQAQLKWFLVWEVFWEFHRPEKLPFPKEQFIAVQNKMDVHLHNEDIEKISKSDFNDALKFHIQTIRTAEVRNVKNVFEAQKTEAQKIMTPYLAIPLADRLKIIEHVFKTVRDEGFTQCDYVLELTKLQQRLPK